MQNDEIDLRGTLRTLRERWGVVAIFALLFFMLGIFWLSTSPKLYRVEVTISPAPAIDETASSQVSALAQGAAMLGLGGGVKGLPTRFDRYLSVLTSEDVGRVLFAMPEIRNRVFSSVIDRNTGGWRRPSGVTASVRGTLNWLVGMPEWTPPTAADMAAFLASNLQIDTASLRNTTTISIRHTDPQFGARLLSTALDAADGIVRQREQSAVSAQIAMLQSQLSSLTNADLRVALANALANQILKQSVAAPNVPFSISRITNVSHSSRPIAPRVSVTLALSIALGVFAGSLFAVLWRWRSPATGFGGVPWNAWKGRRFSQTSKLRADWDEA